MGGACGKGKCEYGFGGKSGVKRPLEWHRLCLEDNIKTDLKVIVWERVDGICQDQDTQKWWAALNTAMNIRAP